MAVWNTTGDPISAIKLNLKKKANGRRILLEFRETRSATPHLNIIIWVSVATKRLNGDGVVVTGVSKGPIKKALAVLAYVMMCR